MSMDATSLLPIAANGDTCATSCTCLPAPDTKDYNHNAGSTVLAYCSASVGCCRPPLRSGRCRDAVTGWATGGAVAAASAACGAGRKTSRKCRGAAGSAAASWSHRKTFPGARGSQGCRHDHTSSPSAPREERRTTCTTWDDRRQPLQHIAGGDNQLIRKQQSCSRTDKHRLQRRQRRDWPRSCGEHAGDDGEALRRLQDAEADARHAVHEASHPRRHAAAAPRAPLHAAGCAPRCLHTSSCSGSLLDILQLNAEEKQNRRQRVSGKSGSHLRDVIL